MRAAVVFGSIILAISGCKKRAIPTESALQVVGGKIITETEEPAVVKLEIHGRRLCTGTMIRPTLVLTAAHCVSPDGNITDNDSAEVPAVNVIVHFAHRSAPATRVVRHPEYPATYRDTRFDLAVIEIAKEHAASDVLPIATDAPKIGDAVKIVGFGIDETPDSAGIKRRGENKLGDVSEFYLNIFRKDGAISSQGDSGSAAIAAKGVIGVATSQTPTGSAYVNLTSEPSREFLQTVLP